MSVTLTSGQATNVFKSGLPPSAPASMSQEERISFRNAQGWILERAQAIQDNLPRLQGQTLEESTKSER
jgi:hypothetical protein